MKQSYLPNVVSLAYNATKCVGCKRCVEVCPHQVFEMSGKLARVRALDACMECGACALNCRGNAIEVNKGVGCAQAFIKGWLRNTEPDCSCDSGSGCC